MRGFLSITKDRIVEAYIGEYASGKSEIAINRALELKDQGHEVTLVDLDTVEPFYTLRTLKKKLEEMGLKVISFEREDAFGLGETGAMLNPRARWALRHTGDIILDIGYGVRGAQTLNLVEGALESAELKILAVINASRPMTNSRDRIMEYLTELGRVDGVVLNTHLGDQSSASVTNQGNRMIAATAAELGIPVAFAVVDKAMQDSILIDDYDVPVKFIHRYMPGAIW